MKAFDFDHHIIDSYERFSRSFSAIRAKDLRTEIDAQYNAGRFWPDALLSLNPRYLSGPTVDDLVVSGDLDEGTGKVFRLNAARDGGFIDRVSGRPAVPHGLRSTFRDWCAETGWPRDMAEIALAHNVGSEVERAYRRSDMLDRRRGMLAAWGRMLAGGTADKVVPIGRSS